MNRLSEIRGRYHKAIDRVCANSSQRGQLLNQLALGAFEKANADLLLLDDRQLQAWAAQFRDGDGIAIYDSRIQTELDALSSAIANGKSCFSIQRDPFGHDAKSD